MSYAEELVVKQVYGIGNIETKKPQQVLQQQQTLCKDYNTCMDKGRDALYLKDYNTTIKYFEAAKTFYTATDWHTGNAMYYIGLSYFYLKNYTQAIDTFTETLLISSIDYSYESHYYRGLSYFYKSIFKKAILDISVAVNHDDLFSDMFAADFQNVLPTLCGGATITIK
jgi:tetratricopeptide (TPR) repeat protein